MALPTTADYRDSTELQDRAQASAARHNGILVQADRWTNIFRHYRTSQILRRAYSQATKRFWTPANQFRWSKNDFALSSNEPFCVLGKIKAQTSYRSKDSIVPLLHRGRVKLLNLTGDINWRIEDGTALLWQFQLHYHEFILPLLNDPEHAPLVQKVIHSWIEKNDPKNRACHIDAWHPYCISRRIPVWCCIFALQDLESEAKRNMVRSLYQQADFLSHNLERELSGNHLLENLRALAWASAFFSSNDSDRWISIVRQNLKDQLDQQILPWGEHCERSPMYHCQVLGNLFETLFLLKENCPDLVDECTPIAKQMYSFLESIIHPDGEIPLFGDSCFGEAPSVSCLCKLSQLVHVDGDSSLSRASPYFIHRDRDNFLIFDRGNAGDDALPAHSHCDLSTIEASVDGERLIVDSGIYNYEDDSMRAYCRSSLGHNVLCVDDRNQFDIWSKFRMGYRGWTSGLDSGEQNNVRWASCYHDAYRRVGVQRTERLLVAGSEFWLCLDRINRPLHHRVAGLLHFAPETQIGSIDSNRFHAQTAKNKLELTILGNCEPNIVSGWYCPEFGLRHSNKAIEYQLCSGEVIAGWMLWVGNRPTAKVKLTSSRGFSRISISYANGETLFQHDWKIVI